MQSETHFCALVPTYNNPNTLRSVVEHLRDHFADVVVVDDGSAEPGRRAAEELQGLGLAHVVHRAQNGGKGAAVKTGLAHAARLGFTHALQIDADGQHAMADVPLFLAASRANPRAMILGQPSFDASAPRGRKIARKISVFWTWLEVGGNAVGDPLCGFRLYPVASALAANARGDRMDFDPEIAVRIAWLGTPIVRIPTSVRYFSAAEGGVSHFAPLRDNWLISKMHTRLMLEKLFWVLPRALWRGCFTRSLPSASRQLPPSTPDSLR